ncbi:MAG: hypothetical protein QOE60_240, partial [Thermoleophilaceae bacterium]|nr:hypothetical protein [Thermoleophilaceae bacterium]
LRAFGLHERLDLRCGGFGDTPAERWRLVDQARRRAGLLRFGSEEAIALEQTIVVGDTVHDVMAATKAGARAVAIASGIYSKEQLAERRPDVLLDDLQDGLATLLDFVGWVAAGASRQSSSTAPKL